MENRPKNMEGGMELGLYGVHLHARHKTGGVVI